MATQKKNSKLDELKNLEAQMQGNIEEQNIDDTPVLETEDTPVEVEEPVMETVEHVNTPTVVDGYRVLARYDMPHGGELYPVSWSFAYRCPTADEVANFSAINEQDQPAIIAAVQDLICKCVVIVDTNSQKQISSKEINDGDRLFFMLKLREFYLPQSPITYNTLCSFCKEKLEVNLTAASLGYYKITDKVMDSFDGRTFNIDMGLTSGPIIFRIPTFETSSRIFRYILNTYRKKSEHSQDSEAFNKRFLLVAPFLYETGTETIEALKAKFRSISRDGERLKAYVDLANNLKFDNKEVIRFTHESPECGSEEVAEIRFPGGWKRMFVGKNSYNGIFASDDE